MTETDTIEDLKAQLNLTPSKDDLLMILMKLLLEYEKQHLGKDTEAGKAKADTNHLFATAIREALDRDEQTDTEFAMGMLSQFAATEAGNTSQTIVLTLAWAALNLVPSHEKRQVTMNLDDLQALQLSHNITQGWTNRGVTVAIEPKKSTEVTSDA